MLHQSGNCCKITIRTRCVSRNRQGGGGGVRGYRNLDAISQGRTQDSSGGGPNFKIFGILDIHAAKRHVASSEAASLC